MTDEKHPPRGFRMLDFMKNRSYAVVIIERMHMEIAPFPLF